MSTSSPQAYAPSTVHQRLIKANKPRLTYDGGDIAAWQRRLRRKLKTLLGLDLMPPRTGRLNVRTLWRREHELGSIEKLVFTAEPGADAPAYLCRPRHADGPPPVFICLQGHSTGMHNSIGVTIDESRPFQPEGDRDFALHCMRRGVAALCIEQRAFGERVEPDPEHPETRLTCDVAAKHALMLGRTLVGERTYDVARGIDLLKHLGGFDLKRLGVMGNSGGGLVSILAGAALPEIRYMMPSCGFCTYRESILSIYHCIDNYIPQMLRYAEMADVLGLFAPRPLVVVAGKDDPLFPIKGVRRAFADVKRVYAACGAEDRCKLVVGQGGHRFFAEPAWRVMSRWLG